MDTEKVMDNHVSSIHFRTKHFSYCRNQLVSFQFGCLLAKQQTGSGINQYILNTRKHKKVYLWKEMKLYALSLLCTFSVHCL